MAPRKMGLAMDGLQGACGVIYRHFAGHVQVKIQNEPGFAILHGTPLDQTGTCVDLGAATAVNGKIRIYTAAGSVHFCQFLGSQRA